MTKDALSDAVEKLRRRLSTGRIDEVEFRRLRDQLLERRATPRPFGGPEQRSTPPPDS